MKSIISALFVALITILLLPQSSMAQTDRTYVVKDSTYVSVDSTTVIDFEPANNLEEYWQADTTEMLEVKQKSKRDWATWRPNPKRAMWLAIVLPGAGQIYNRKYWKLPIIYGGFVGSIYALQWNNQMYHDYSQAFLDLSDEDPNTQSYNQFLHLGNQITEANEDRYKTLFKKRKDYFRRYRDLSFFVLLGVYAISVIDAYVDASLSEFDISKDLSMKVSPAVINDQLGKNPFKSNALGLQCSFSF